MATIYYRKSLMDTDELTAAKQFFPCVDLISNLPSNELIIGRYSLYPFFSDQKREIENMGSKLINDYNQHLYIADLGNYVIDLDKLTPRTWRNIQDIPDKGPFILKGETNSKKSHWKNFMYAEDKEQAITVHNRLIDDSLIGDQKIYIREYIPLVKYLDGINGMPISKEFRFFVAYKQLLCGGFYWANYIEDLGEEPSSDEVPREFLQEVIEKIDNQSNFYVIDVGQAITGEWIVIELNDGMQSGLSCVDPNVLYKNLSVILKNNIHVW